MGLGQCPYELRKHYSFGYNLVKNQHLKKNPSATEEALEKLRIDSIEWSVNQTSSLISDDPTLPIGYLLINEGAFIGGLTAINHEPVKAYHAYE